MLDIRGEEYMLKKLLFLLFIILVIFVGNTVYNYNVYFFNPYIFKEDHITYLPYTAYKKTMGYTFTDYCKQDNTKILLNVNDIKFMYTELKKGEVLGNSVDSPSLSIKPKRCITIYSDIDNKKEMSIVSDVVWYGEDYDYVKVSGEFEIKGEKMSGYLFIRMTTKIQKFFNLKFKFLRADEQL